MLSITHCRFFGVAVEKAEVPTDAYQEEDRQKNLAFLLEKVEGCAVCLFILANFKMTSPYLPHIHIHTRTYTQSCGQTRFLFQNVVFGGITVTSKWMIITAL